MEIPRSLTALQSSRPLWAASAMSTIGSLMFAMACLRLFGNVPLVTYAALHAVLNAAIFAWTYLHPHLRRWLVITLVLAIVVPFYYLIWHNHILLAGSHLLWAPFLGVKIIIITLAVTNAGPLWLSLILIAGFAIESFFLWFHLNIGSLPSSVVAGEPWFTGMFFMVSTGLLLFRWRHDAMERELLTAKLQSELLSHVAHLFLQVRDQANTPLQQLTLAVELLDSGASTPQEQAAGMRRALKKLIELNQRFSQYNDLVSWDGNELEDEKKIPDKLLAMERRLFDGSKAK